MTDLEQDLRDLLATKARDGAVAGNPAPPVLKRARRRQLGTVLTSILGTAAIVVGAVVGLQALIESEPSPNPPVDVPVLPDAPPGFRSVALPYASLAYPEGWSVLAFADGPEVVQVTNFDPEFAKMCLPEGQPLPPLGVVLLVERAAGAASASDRPWPVSLAR